MYYKENQYSMQINKYSLEKPSIDIKNIDFHILPYGNIEISTWTEFKF